MIEDDAQYHCPVYRTKIGESNVIDKILECQTVGGEGNGGVMIPAITSCRDSFIGMGLVLQYMAETGKSISATLLVEAIRYFMVKRKVILP